LAGHRNSPRWTTEATLVTSVDDQRNEQAVPIVINFPPSRSSPAGADEIFNARSEGDDAFERSGMLESIATDMGSCLGGAVDQLGPNQTPQLQDDLNCAVWIMNIPPQADHRELLYAIRHCGRIFSCWINPPTSQHRSCASKIVFTTRRGAENFIRQVISPSGVHVLGQRITAIWNRHKYREHRNQAQSRVIRLHGPACYVNRKTLDAYFSKLFFYHTCAVVEYGVNDGMQYVDWYFGSILAQSAAAQMAISKEPLLKSIVSVEYLPDPCE
jgi:hypothetical protein